MPTFRSRSSARDERIHGGDRRPVASESELYAECAEHGEYVELTAKPELPAEWPTGRSIERTARRSVVQRTAAIVHDGQTGAGQSRSDAAAADHPSARDHERRGNRKADHQTIPDLISDV